VYIKDEGIVPYLMQLLRPENSTKLFCRELLHDCSTANPRPNYLVHETSE